MKKIIVCVFCFSMLVFTTTANAHVMNDNNVYEDISLSEASNDIVLLSALGAISNVEGEQQFKPQQTLSVEQLAAWAAKFNGLEGETTVELAQAAIVEDIVQSLSGDATYELVNQLYFAGAVDVENAQKSLTREQFVHFIVENLSKANFLQTAQFIEGPTGVVDDVQQVEKDGYHIYKVTIAGETYELSAHPYAIAQSADPSVWVGQEVTQSFIATNGLSNLGQGEESTAMALQLVVIDKQPYTFEKQEQQNEVVQDIEQSLQQVEVIDEEQTEEPSSNNWLVIVMIALLIVVITALTIKRKKK